MQEQSYTVLVPYILCEYLKRINQIRKTEHSSKQEVRKYLRNDYFSQFNAANPSPSKDTSFSSGPSEQQLLASATIWSGKIPPTIPTLEPESKWVRQCFLEAASDAEAFTTYWKT